METEKTNIFQRFIASLYNFKAYAGFLEISGGKTFLYSLLLVAVTYAVTWALPMRDVLAYINKLDTSVVDEYVPYFAMENGVFTMEDELFFEEPNGALLVYATPEAVSADQARDVLRGYMQGFIISRDYLLIKQATVPQVQEFAFADMGGVSFTRADLYTFIPVIKWFVWLLYPLAFAAFIGVYMFGSLVCALLALLANAFVKAPVSFGGLFKLTQYARTAPILVKMAFVLVPALGSLHFAAFYLLFLLYMVWVLRAVKKNAAPDGGDIVDVTN